MAYDPELADRLRRVLPELVPDAVRLTEQRMFGGLGFMLDGHMAVAAASDGGLLLRIDPARAETLTERPHAQRFTMRGRAMNGWLSIDPAGLDDDDTLRDWVAQGVGYVGGLPPKG